MWSRIKILRGKRHHCQSQVRRVEIVNRDIIFLYLYS